MAKFPIQAMTISPYYDALWFTPPAPSRLSQLSVQDWGSQEFDLETSSLHSGQGHDPDTSSLGSRTSEYTPTLAVALYNYTVRHTIVALRCSLVIVGTSVDNVKLICNIVCVTY